MHSATHTPGIRLVAPNDMLPVFSSLIVGQPYFDLMLAYLVTFTPPAQCEFSTVKYLRVEQPPKQSCTTFMFLERGTLSLDWPTFLARRSVNGGDGIVVQKLDKGRDGDRWIENTEACP